MNNMEWSMQSGENILIENEKKVSIIMPVFNSEKYVSEAIESVCHQSYKNWELLIVNDGSVDLSAKIIEKYAKKDSRITVFHKRNEGVSNARNFALGKISGEYVTFIDSDDVYHTDRIKKMVQVFEKHGNCDVVFSRHNEFTGKLIKIEQIGLGKTTIYDEDIVLKVISDSRNHFIWNTMLRSSIAKKGQFASIRFAEDFCYIRDCAWCCREIAVLDEVLYYYRRDNKNAMTSHFFTEKYITDYMKLVENCYSFCKNHELEDTFYKRMVAHEYAQNSMRIRKSTSYLKFVNCMNDKSFREGINYADASQCTLFERILFYLIKHKVYLPFAFWIW